MNDLHAFLANLAIVLGVAAVTTVVFQKLRQPVVFGYMLAGLLIGPHIPLPLVADRAIVQALAELGVLLLMFSLGLDFSLRRIVRAGPAAGLIALLETSLMMWLGFGASRLLGWTSLESAFVGGAVAISSTTIILKAFRERGVRGPGADLVFSILIAEDVIAILLLAILTPVASGHALSAGGLAITVMRLVGFLVLSTALGLLVVPRLIRMVVALRRPETLVVASVGLCFAGALLAQRLGYSGALGAFLAGALVAESGEGALVERRIEPIRDLFAAVFFVAVGMLVDPALAARHAGAIVAFTALVLVGKVGAVSASAVLAGRGLQDAVRAGMSLAQIGEFSFILAAVGVASGATGSFVYAVVVGVSALTTLLTPLLIAAAPATAALVDRRLPRPFQTFVGLYGTWIENARRRPAPAAEAARVRRALRLLMLDAALLAALALAALIESEGLSRLLVSRVGLGEIAARVAVVAAALALAAPFAIGVARTSGTLGQALAARAFPPGPDSRLDPAAAPRRAMVVTVRLAAFAIVGMLLGALTQPVLPAPLGIVTFAALLAALAVAFWRSAADLRGHARAGAQVIVAALARQSRAPTAQSDAALTRAYELVPGLGTPVPVRLDAASPAVGRTIGELELRGRTGATILAVVRGEQVVLVPDGHHRLAEGDVLALGGPEGAVAEARRQLLGGGTGP